MSKRLYHWALWFLGLGVIIMPFPYHILGGTWTSSITSDSLALYQLMGGLFFVALLLSLFMCKWSGKILPFIRILLVYFLALHLLKYGLDKVFKTQFYLPEPNLLYTPLGQMDKDILYWSVMGLSRPYNIFLGCLECIPALLLLHRRTRLLGLLAALPILLHIVVLNFCYDISVKVFSTFLFCIALSLFLPYSKSVFVFLLTASTTQKYVVPTVPFQRGVRQSVKGIVIILLCIEGFFHYFQTQNFNDDIQERPYLHGAYQVQYAEQNGVPTDVPIHRFFIHRRGYFILQFKDNTMQDFKMKMNPNLTELHITDYEQQTKHIPFYFEPNNDLVLRYPLEMDTLYIYAQTLNWQKLPALQTQFHWKIEDVQ